MRKNDLEAISVQLVEKSAAEAAEKVARTPAETEEVSAAAAEEAEEKFREEADGEGVTAPNKPVLIGPDSVAAETEGGYNALSRSFEARLILANDFVKQAYSELKNYLCSYKKVRTRLSWRSETFRCNRKIIAKFVIKGKTLCLYFALEQKDAQAASAKLEEITRALHSKTPYMFCIKNPLRIRQAKKVIDFLAAKYSLVAGESGNVDYAPPAESEEELLSRGLIRKVKNTYFNK